MKRAAIAVLGLLLVGFVFAGDVHAQAQDALPVVSENDEFEFPEYHEDVPRIALGTQGENAQDEELSSLSAIEAMYAERLETPPKQFGYEIFAGDALENKPDKQMSIPIGAVQDDFILGIGDEVQIAFSGQHNTRQRVKIDSEGQLMIPDLPPIMAAGLSMAQLRGAVEQAAQGLHNTQVYLSLSAVRQIGVLVVGHVQAPGRYDATVFHTVLDALMQAGGVSKDGSLRQIKLVRGAKSHIIDLYDVLMQGGLGQDLRLRDGDRIVVPPIGATVVVAGDVKRAGIYEIKTDPFKGLMGKSKNRLTLRELLGLGGGVLRAGQNRYTHLAVRENGYEVAQEIQHTDTTPIFGDGSILLVARAKDKKSAQIELLGQTRKAGVYDLARYQTLSALLDDPQALGDDIYPLCGVIERWNAETLSHSYLSFPVRFVLKKRSDIPLKDGDKIYLLSNHDVYSVFSDKEDKTNENEKAQIRPEKDAKIPEFLAKNPALNAFLKENAVVVRGAVRYGGWYPVAQSGISLEDVLAVAGGLSRDADQGNIEITATTPEAEDLRRRRIDLRGDDPKHVMIKSGDAVRVMQLHKKMQTQGVLIIGEVKNPGRYDVLPEDKISDLIQRAGGLTPQAYPAGAVFSREAERRAEEARYRAAAQDIERSLAGALQREKNVPDAAQIESARALAAELGRAKGLGRITVEADPQILAMKPELDMYLEDGDRFYIPKRPLTVRVSGEVLSPASLQFRQGKAPLDYIHEAGGFTYHADKGRTFVLYPDGSAQPLRVNTWNHTPVKIPPGASIIVPRDPKPFDFIESARDITQILSNLAVTSILVDDLQD